MCGICGQLRFDGTAPAPGLAEAMCATIRHRGPDDEGHFRAGPLAMGMRRLNVIDLVSGSQPIYNETGTLAIVFNGEIYNFEALREDLLARGHRFATSSDTEVIVHGYEEYGKAVVERLNGMFAFAIWDTQAQRLFLARDRLGVKPLYLHVSPRALTFGSEIKTLLVDEAIERALDPTAFAHYLALEYVPAPRTLFAGIQKLPPGHTAEVGADGTLVVEPYWDPIAVPQRPASQGEDELAEELRDLLTDAVRLRMISDVPLGAFLSGGIDSSTVVALMSGASSTPVKTFSIGFPDRSYDETAYAAEIARKFGTDHREFMVNPDVLNLVTTLVDYLDDPIGDFSVFPTYVLSQVTRDHVTVALSGDGGDELFGGYETYVADDLARQVSPWLLAAPVRRALATIRPTDKKKGYINKLKRFAEGFDHPADLSHVRWMTFWTERELDALFVPEVGARVACSAHDVIRPYFEAGAYGPATRSMYVDIKTYMTDDILVKVDRMSMANSLEVRSPFLDYRVVEFALSLADDLKLRGRNGKYILKRAMKDLLPARITGRGKEGFSMPVKNWLRGDMRTLMRDVLTERRIEDKGFVRWPVVERLMEEHLAGRQNHSHKLWALIMFELWHDRFMVAPVRAGAGPA
jgi:asparagine synthase (glutamine-hydrolysing)